MSYFFQDAQGKRQGPVSVEALKAAFLGNEISAENLVWFHGLENWKPIKKIDGLLDKLNLIPSLVSPPLNLKSVVESPKVAMLESVANIAKEVTNDEYASADSTRTRTCLITDVKTIREEFEALRSHVASLQERISSVEVENLFMKREIQRLSAPRPNAPSLSLPPVPQPQRSPTVSVPATPVSISAPFATPVPISAPVAPVSPVTSAVSSRLTPPEQALEKSLDAAVSHDGGTSAIPIPNKILSSSSLLESIKLIARRSEMRITIASDLVVSEGSYVMQLRACVEHFLSPIRLLSAKDNEMPDAKQLGILFCNIETLFTFHQSFLEDLKRKSLSEVFPSLTPFLSMYQQYFDNFPQCLQTLTLLQSNEAFQSFLRLKRDDLSVNGELAILFLAPLNRLSKYASSLRELVAQTESTDPDFALLRNVLLPIEALSSSISATEVRQEAEQMVPILVVQQRLQDNPIALYSSDHLFISENKMTVVDQEKRSFFSKDKERLFFLFSDLVIWSSTTGIFKGCAYLSQARITDAKENADTHFHLHVPSASFLLACSTADLKTSFMRTFKALSESRASSASSHRLRDNSISIGLVPASVEARDTPSVSALPRLRAPTSCLPAVPQESHPGTQSISACPAEQASKQQIQVDYSNVMRDLVAPSPRRPPRVSLPPLPPVPSKNFVD